MFHERMFLDDWEDKNVQPSRVSNKLPLCPNYDIIEICAELAGTSPEELGKEPRFCGVKLDLVMESYWPQVACWETQQKLTSQLVTAKRSPSKTNLDIDSILKSEKSLDEKEAALHNFKKNKNEIAEREEILTRFRRVIFDNHSYVPEANETRQNPHFKTVSRPEDLSEEEIFSKVGQFINRLSEITGRIYEPESRKIDLSEVSRPAKNCAKCPSHYSARY